jgi:uncharacterized protein (TIGR03085 family)
MSDYARRERLRLADLLETAGPGEPTLCAGWTTRDLAAHLVVRERRPDAMAGVLIPPLAGHGEHVRKELAAQPYGRTVDQLRTPPWWSHISNPLTDELANTVEFFVHHEDVRRARPGWQPRTLDDGHQRALWRAVKLTGRLSLRRSGLSATVRSAGFGEFTVGDDPEVAVSGPPGELSLFLAGRQRAARVDVEGPGEATERLRNAKLGF